MDGWTVQEVQVRNGRMNRVDFFSSFFTGTNVFTVIEEELKFKNDFSV